MLSLSHIRDRLCYRLQLTKPEWHTRAHPTRAGKTPHNRRAGDNERRLGFSSEGLCEVPARVACALVCLSDISVVREHELSSLCEVRLQVKVAVDQLEALSHPDEPQASALARAHTGHSRKVRFHSREWESRDKEEPSQRHRTDL